MKIKMSVLILGAFFFMNLNSQEKINLKNISPNEWIEVEEDNNGSAFQAIVFDPIIGKVMQWTNTLTDKGHNVKARVRHFDPISLSWIDDYPAVKNGRDVRFGKNWSMAGEYPAPLLHLIWSLTIQN
ncbi:MAG: hypothetical protein COA79_26375 [Planctomycetota bacterium]|nr:MAG: hypothetical protein COA79_26375 [Planctomycetota bacterium]